MELMVCQMLFAQLSKKTSLKISHVLLFGHFSGTLQNCPIMFYYGKANPVNQRTGLGSPFKHKPHKI